MLAWKAVVHVITLKLQQHFHGPIYHRLFDSTDFFGKTELLET